KSRRQPTSQLSSGGRNDRGNSAAAYVRLQCRASPQGTESEWPWHSTIAVPKAGGNRSARLHQNSLRSCRDRCTRCWQRRPGRSSTKSPTSASAAVFAGFEQSGVEEL